MLGFPVVIELADYQTSPLIVANGIAKWKTEWAGDLDTLAGFITNLGTGSGQTKIRIYNETQTRSMLTAAGDGSFVVANATNLLEGFAVDRANSKYNKGDVIRLDITEVPGGADSSIISVHVHTIALPDQV